MEPDGVDGVELVARVEVGVEPVHDHHELVGVGAALLRVDEESAVETLVNVGGQRTRVAVVEVQAERIGIELVGEALAGLDRAAPESLVDPVHAGRVDPVEVDRVGMLRAVDEVDPQTLAFAGTQGRTGHAPVVGPGGELHARGDFDLLVLGHDLPLPQHPPAREPARLSHIEIAHDLRGIEAVGCVVDRPPGLEAVARHRVPRASGVSPAGPCRGGRGGRRQVSSDAGQPGGGGSAEDRGESGDHAATRKLVG